MICQHLSDKRETAGQTTECLNCHQQIIHDGTKWRWAYDLSTTERRGLQQQYAFERVTRGSAS